MRIGLVQLSVTDDPTFNLPQTISLIRLAHQKGARFILTPEGTNLLSTDRTHQQQVLHLEKDDPTLAALCVQAAQLKVWLLVGSLCLLADSPAQNKAPFVNRSFLIDPKGNIKARYDKIHMFDVVLNEHERYHESAAYQPGERAILADMHSCKLGMSICYDLRFPHLYRKLAQAGADIISVPAAFSHITGPVHWDVLLRARAIETGCFVLAPAQTGIHRLKGQSKRQTHGHSLAISPWGEVLCDGGTSIGVSIVDIDLADVHKARQRIPSITHDRAYQRP